MKVRVICEEVAKGNVLVDVPDNATEEDIYMAAHEAWTGGHVFFNTLDFNIIEWANENV